MGEHQFFLGGGDVRGFEKNCNDVSPTMGNPEQYPCDNLLSCLRSIGTIFVTTEID